MLSALACCVFTACSCLQALLLRTRRVSQQLMLWEGRRQQQRRLWGMARHSSPPRLGDSQMLVRMQGGAAFGSCFP